MGQTTFGFGDTTGHNNWTFAGAGTSSDDEWENSSFATGQFGRIIDLAARWSGYTSAVGAGSCSNPTGQSALWTGNSAPNLSSSSYGASTVSSGGAIAQFNNAATADFWQNNGTYWTGFHSGSCLYYTGTTNTGSYNGGNASQGPGCACTACWGGTGCFGFGTYGTIQVTEVYIRRGAAWSKFNYYIRRSAAWVLVNINIRRTGAWTTLNYLKQSDPIQRSRGIAVEVNVGEGWEPGYLVETDHYGWFGSVDPHTLGIAEWWKPFHTFNPHRWTGRYNSAEPDEVVEARLTAAFEWDRALRDENYALASRLHPLKEPGLLPTLADVRSVMGPRKTILVPKPAEADCGCKPGERSLVLA